MTRAADDFEAIRTRRDELCRDRDIAISGGVDPLPDEWLTPEALERIERERLARMITGRAMAN